ncbi:hypothetical protein KW797_03635, partial [Candidatus Parcubacteria bacterium]|nr:hypothetical protein [Candidatus Parcubacteria bacterium]
MLAPFPKDLLWRKDEAGSGFAHDLPGELFSDEGLPQAALGPAGEPLGVEGLANDEGLIVEEEGGEGVGGWVLGVGFAGDFVEVSLRDGEGVGVGVPIVNGAGFGLRFGQDEAFISS